MRAFRLRRLGLLVLTGLFLTRVSATPILAQAEGPVGVRATGMGGAFTAVADDGSATFWNPAGFATGSFFSLVIDGNALDRRSGVLVAIGTPPLGIAYYRTATAEVPDGRATLVAHHAGVTLVQSIGGHLAVGATLKLVHGVASPGQATAVSSNKFDADLGLMATGSLVKVGLSVRNLLEPEFKAEGGAIRLDRRVRAGVSVHVWRDTSMAADVDLTKSTTFSGEWRDVALGVESHPLSKGWVRGGVHWNAAGGSSGPGAAPVASVGASYAIYGSLMADGQVSFGSSSGDRGWGLGLRFVF
jgi:hypothetical protein